MTHVLNAQEVQTNPYPPGPAPLKNIVEQLRFGYQVSQNILAWMMDNIQKYGETVHAQIGKSHMFIFTNPEDIHTVTVSLANKFNKGPEYKDQQRGLARFVGNGILVSDGEFWKKQRRLVSPALHVNRVNTYGDVMVQYTDNMLNTWHDGQHLDMDEQMMELTLKIVSQTLFKVDADEYTQTMGKILSILLRIGADFDIFPNWVPTPKHRREERALQELDKILYALIENWREASVDRGDLLSMLMLAEDTDGNHMSDKQLRDEIATLLLAGHETTANMLNWTWYLLSQNPDIEAKLHEEVDTVLQGRLPTLEDLKSLPYTDMVMKESMRIFPPAWGFTREANEDVEVNGKFVPKGSLVSLMVYGMHHDPRWWEDPETFQPERFAPENEDRFHKRAYLPFGGGPRVCVGNSFATMEGRLLIATIAQRYKFTLAPDARIDKEALVTLRPRHGMPMIAHLRKPN